MQPISREQNRRDGIIPPFTHNNRIIYFIHSCFYSWVLGFVDIFQPCLRLHSSRSYQDSLVSPAPCFAACQRKGQPSFSQRRMCLLVPHPPQCVHKNLHNSSGKCQYTVIRCSWHYCRAPHCDLEKLAENKRSKWWITLFSSPMITRTEAGDNVATETFFYFLWLRCEKRKSDTYWRMWAWRNGPLLFLTGFW